MRASELIPTNHSSQTRSWRRTVAHPVALAQCAVELDSKNADPMAALDAYMESVRYLKCILARLRRHGAHLEASRLTTIVRRVTSNSNERLFANADGQSESYCERMRLLCVVCGVPPPPYDYPSSELNGRSSRALPTLPSPPAYEEPSHVPTRAEKPLEN